MLNKINHSFFIFFLFICSGKHYCWLTMNSENIEDLYDCEEDMGIEIEEVPISQPSELPTLEMVPRIEEEGDREMWAIYVLFSVIALHCFVGFKNVQVNLKKRTRDAVGLRNDCGEMCLKKAKH